MRMAFKGFKDKLPENWAKRAEHWYTEFARVEAGAEAWRKGDIEEYGRLVRRTWQQNCLLDPGTNPPVVQQLCQRIDDLCLGYKLPGAGGGGYLYMVAKDPEAAMRIRRILTENPSAPTARFVEMTLSAEGMQISRS